ncbi:hypothetical protein [Citrobacter sp. CRE-46]|uniref:hypothetical protein n=1 Tax=Citrobacter sp. CRE-46 TaxID=1703250 RepID=UPI00351A211C
MVHCRACHYSQVAPGCVDHPVFTITLRRTSYAPDNLLYRFALEETRAHSIGDFVQPVSFKLLPPLFQQTPLEGLRHCRSVNLLWCDTLERNVLENLLRNNAAEEVQLIPRLILNVTRQFARQRGINRFICLLVEVTRTSQQRCQATGAVGISTLAVQQHQQSGGQVSIQLVE